MDLLRNLWGWPLVLIVGIGASSGALSAYMEWVWYWQIPLMVVVGWIVGGWAYDRSH